MKKFFIGAAVVVTGWALVLVGCPEENAGPTTYPYVCTNGTAATGAADTENVSNCTACAETHMILGEAGVEGSTCAETVYPYICENGDAAPGTTTTKNVSNCTECTGTHMILGEAGVEGSTCAETVYPYICANGTVAPGTTTTENVSNCTECTGTYMVVGGAGTAGSVCAYPYICENGTAADPAATTTTTTTENVSNCTECTGTHMILGEAGVEGSTCAETVYPYVCTNGTPAAATTNMANVSNCTECTGTYVVVGGVGIEGSVCAYPYICENGTAADPVATTTTENVSNCAACINDDYTIMGGVAGTVGTTCVQTAFPYICENGTVAPGTTNMANVSNCTACAGTYVVVGGAGTEGSVCAYPFICENGTAADPVATTTTENVSNCTACINDDYSIMGGVAGTVGTTCVQTAFPYVCTNGMPSAGRGTSADTNRCALCDLGFSPSGTLNTDGSTCTAISGCEAPITGTNASVSTLYADGNYAACSALTLAATNSIGAFSSDSMTTFAEANGGADSTSKAYTLNNPTDAATFAGGFISLAADTDVSGKALQFSIMSPESGGTSMVRVYLQDGSYTSGDAATYQSEATEGIITFPRNGMWHDVSIIFNNEYTFTGANITAAGVRVIGFAIVEDTNGGTTAGLGAQTFSIDEVRIEDNAPNCTAPAMGDASVDLVWGDAVYSSCSEISNSFYGAVQVPTQNTANRPASSFAFAASALGGGASGTPLFTNFTVSGGYSTWAYAIVEFPSSAYYNATGKTLKFSVKSPSTGGATSLDIFLEDNGGNRTSIHTARVVNDGTWQEISLLIGTDLRGISVVNSRRVVFSLPDTNGLSVPGLGAGVLSLDEIRFE